MELLELYNKIEDKYKNFDKYYIKPFNTETNISLHFLDNCLTDEDIIKNKLLNYNFKILAENSLLFKGEMKGVIYANALTKIYF